MKRKAPPRGGFVLVMVLVLLTIAAIALAGLARKSLQYSLSVADAEEELQRRWGLVSCEQVFLNQSEFILEKKDRKRAEREALVWPHSKEAHGMVELGEYQFHVHLADENAKANLNTLHYRSPDLVRVTQSIFLEQTKVSALTVRLLPLHGLDPEGKLPVFQSWGQVLLPSGGIGIDHSAFVERATQETTCWGNGDLNLGRASDEAIRAIGRRVVPKAKIEALIERRNELMIEDPTELLKGLDLRESERTKLRRLFSDRSRCHTLWVTLEKGLHSQSTLFVDRPGRGYDTNRLTFTW